VIRQTILQLKTPDHMGSRSCEFNFVALQTNWEMALTAKTNGYCECSGLWRKHDF
jgi:hypothetical protein